MTRRLVLASLACAAAIVAIWFWRAAGEALEQRAPPPLAPPSSASPSSVAVAAAEANDGSTPLAIVPEAPRARRSANVSEPLAEASDAPPAPEAEVFALEILVLDAEGQPVAGADVFAAPLDGAWNRAGVTGDDGRLSLRLASRAANGEVALALGADGRPALPLRRVALSSEHVVRVALGARARARELVELEERLALPPRPADATSSVRRVSGRARSTRTSVAILERGSDPDEGPVQGAEPATAEAEEEREDVPIRATPPEASGDLAVRANGAGSFRDPPRPPPRDDRLRSARRERLALAQERVRVQLGEQAAQTRSGATVEGRITDSDGRAVSDVRVSFRVDGALEIATKSDRGGHFVLYGLQPGEHELVACGGALGRDARTLRVAAGDHVVWDPVLERGLVLGGRIVDSTEKAIQDAWVEIESEAADPPRWNRAKTQTEGHFAIPNLPQASVRLLAGFPEQRHLPALVLESALAGQGHPTFTLHEDERPSATVAVELSFEEAVIAREGFVAPPAELRLWHLDSGRGVWLAPDAHDRNGAIARSARHIVRVLPAGRYELWIGAAGRRWVKLGPFGLSAAREIELGGILIAQPGRVRFEASTVATGTWSARILRSDAALEIVVESFAGRLEEERVFELAEGSYELELEARAERRIIPFEVRAGRETLVRLAD